MTGSVNRRRPEGAPSLDINELTETPAPEPSDGEVLMRTIYLSLNSYMRGRMNATKSYAAPVAIGQPMVGGTVGRLSSPAIQNTPLATSSSAKADGRNMRFRMTQAYVSSTRKRPLSQRRSASSACRE